MIFRTKIPSAITLFNLFLGCIAVVWALTGKLFDVPYIIIIAVAADFFDGFAARMLKATSKFGLQLDSLADMVTFGVVPGLIMYQLLTMSFEGTGLSTNLELLYLAPAFLITLSAALRLAKFNIDERQQDGFLGLPTPACTAFIVSLVPIVENNTFGLANIVLSEWFLYIVTVLFSFLMVVELPMFTLKFKHFRLKGNELRYLSFVVFLTLLLTVGWFSFTICVLLYILFSVINAWVVVPRKQRA